jgi:hypothetical protein
VFRVAGPVVKEGETNANVAVAVVKLERAVTEGVFKEL